MTEQELSNVLDQYVTTVIPALYRQNYHLLLAKGGPRYPHLPEQPFLTHLLNGTFGLARLVSFLIRHNVPVPGLDVKVFSQSVVLYTLHDVGKLPGVEHLDKTEFSLPLERLRQEYEALELKNFAEVDEHMIRAVNVHKRSPRHGDLLQTLEANAPLLYTLVRLADAMASAVSPEEAFSSLQTWLKRLGPEFTGKGHFALYWHQLRDVRGVLTNTIHHALASQLEKDHSFFPLLFFATGTLYLGPRTRNVGREALLTAVVDKVLQALGTGSQRAKAKEAIRPTKYDFEAYVYAFADIQTLLELVRDDSLVAKPDTNALVREDRSTRERSPGKDFGGLLAKKGLPAGWTSSTVFPKLGLVPDEPNSFVERWARAYRYLLYADSLAKALVPIADQPEKRLDWFLRSFPVPQPAADNLRKVGGLWAKGGPGKYVIPIAYHFLRGPAFSDRPAEASPDNEILECLHQYTLQVFAAVDTEAGRKAAVDELGFHPELTTYLQEHLSLSWAPAMSADNDTLTAYIRPKRKKHRDRLCSLCNRNSQYVNELRTGILDDEGRIFSNRVLPALQAPGENRPWCPICHLEFVLHKLAGLGLPSGADYGNTRRLYLYVLPTFSFTPEQIRLFSRWLNQFQRVTSLPVRDYGPEAGMPNRWLLHRNLDPDWLEEVQRVLDKQAERISGQGGIGYVGERLVVGQVQRQPHYYLIVWEKAARRREQDDARVATRTEAWAKGIFAAILVAALSGCKVYVTERPYLPVTDPGDLKATVVLDGPPPALRSLVEKDTDGITLYGREQGDRSGLEQALDLAAALWTVTAEVHGPRRQTKDKHISERLALVNTSPLAGATFYKEYSRLNEGRSPDEVLTRACEALLTLRGGDLMDLVQQLAEKSLEIALPTRGAGRGKPRRYELIFRETVTAMRRAFDAIPELRHRALTNQPPSEQSVSELKRLTAGTLLKALERRQEQRRGETFVRAWGDTLSRLVGEFVDLVVDQVYLNRAGGSFAHFLRQENTLADGIFYYTDRVLSEKWEEYNAQRAKQQDQTMTTTAFSESNQ